MKHNFTFKTDSYKFGGHWNMLPEGTERVYSYAEARTGGEYDYVVFHGLQAIIEKYLSGVQVEQWMIEDGEVLSKFHLGSEKNFNSKGWQIIVDEFGGKLPIEIKAVEEGSIVPNGNVLFTIIDTDEKKRFAWLTNYIETILMKVWYPTTVATRSYTILQNIRKQWLKSSDLPVEIADFCLHDFGARSTTSEESAAIGGCAHLTSGMGTDTIAGMEHAKEFYHASYENLAFSVPATEHSIATAYGEGEGELNYIKTMIEKYPDGILSMVYDSFGIINLVENITPKAKDLIIDRWKNGKAPVNRFVIRPDSPRFPDDTAWEQVLWLHEALEKIFGSTVNSKGKKVLHPAVGVIYGDGLKECEIFKIYEKLIEAGWSVENCVVGQGGGLLQALNRDTQRFAIKCSAQMRNGEWVKIQKKPSDITKASKAGRMKLFKEIAPSGQWEYNTITESQPLYHDVKDELLTVFKNGEVTRSYTFNEIRAKIKKDSNKFHP